jgi:hypothetical protein
MNRYCIINLNEFKGFHKNRFENLFNSFPWFLLLEKTYSFKIFLLEDKKVNIIIPFNIIDNDIEKTIKSLPFSDYSLFDIPKECVTSSIFYLQNLFPNFQIIIKLIQANYETELRKIKNISIREIGWLNQINLCDWVQPTKVYSNHERNINKALSLGVTVQISNSMASVRKFYDLHLKLRVNKFKKLPQSLYYFENLHKIFLQTNQGFILEAHFLDEIIASWIILSNKNVLYYKYGASKPEMLKYRPNDLLFRKLILEGLKKSYNKIDMGYTGNSENYKGLIRFKKKGRGNIRPILEYCYLPDNYNIDKQKTKLSEINKIIEKAILEQNFVKVRELSKSFYYLFA